MRPRRNSGCKAVTGNGVKPSWYCVKIYIIAGSNSCCVPPADFAAAARRAQTRTVSCNILSPFISIVYSHRSSYEFRKPVSPSPHRRSSLVSSFFPRRSRISSRIQRRRRRRRSTKRRTKQANIKFLLANAERVGMAERKGIRGWR